MNPEHLRLYIILDLDVLDTRDPLSLTQELLQAGATMLQIRAKSHPQRQIATLVERLHPLTQSAQVPLLLNDHVGLALALGVEGVHVGTDDCPPSFIRHCWPHAIIGYSPEQPEDSQCLAADYLGIGPFATTTTKADAGHAIGASGLQAYRAIRPFVAIGGITPTNAHNALAAGAAGIAVCNSVLQAQHPHEVIHSFLTILKTSMRSL